MRSVPSWKTVGNFQQGSFKGEDFFQTVCLCLQAKAAASVGAASVGAGAPTAGANKLNGETLPWSWATVQSQQVL